MGANAELTAYLEREKAKLNGEFSKYAPTTEELFRRVADFLDTDFEGMTDNRVYRYLLTTFRELICYAFEEDVSKAYLRGFFRSMNGRTVVDYLVGHARSRQQDIRAVMDRFLHFFVATWQGFNDDKKKVLEEILFLIDHWM